MMISSLTAVVSSGRRCSFFQLSARDVLGLVILLCAVVDVAYCGGITAGLETDSNRQDLQVLETNDSNPNKVCIDMNGNIDPKCNLNSNIKQKTMALDDESDSIVDNDDDDNEDDTEQQSVLPGCRLVMAPSSLPNGGWGVYSLVDMQRGHPVIDGDVVIQVTDLNMTNADETFLVVQDYLWNSEETGGYYEGKQVVSVVPGLGMLANGLPNKLHNVLPFVPTVDEGGLVRSDSPGSGAISYYHNYTFYVWKPIQAGSEIFVNYGPNWFLARQNRITAAMETISAATEAAIGSFPAEQREEQRKLLHQLRQPHDVAWLRKYGRCLDNIKPDKSKQKDAGRGVFAQRYIPSGGIVAPVPVVVFGRKELLDVTRVLPEGRRLQTKQLLLNYCLGHPKSSLLLFPYSPMVNLINHGGGKHANVRLQWSKSKILHKTGLQWLHQNISLSELKSMNQSGLLFELVAIKPIRTGEEILLDYGIDWIEAWIQHVSKWKPVPDAESYAPAYVQDDVIQSLRTETELENHPYPDNVITSCFYKYSDNKVKAESQSDTTNEVTTFQWNMTRGIFDLGSLRPCKILQRVNPPANKKKKGTVFTVRMKNRFGLPQIERIPEGKVHIVTDVPRHAIRFTDRLYSTDQHLENAFRKEIGIPDDIFPSQWKDLP